MFIEKSYMEPFGKFINLAMNILFKICSHDKLILKYRIPVPGLEPEPGAIAGTDTLHITALAPAKVSAPNGSSSTTLQPARL
jgi:hypothetical protein